MTRHLPLADPMLRTIATLALASFAALAIWFLLSSENGAGPDGTSPGDAALPSSIRVDGAVETAERRDGSITQIIVPLALRGEDGLRLSDGGRVHATTLLADTASAAVPATYTVAWLDGNGDEVLDPGEHALLTVDLPPASSIKSGRPVDLTIRPTEGAPLTIEDVLP